MRTDMLLKAISVTAVLGLLVMASGGCSPDADATDTDGRSISTGDSASTTTSGSDGRIVFEVDSSALLKDYYMTVDDINAAGNVDVIVKGKVLSTQDVYEDHFAARILTVKVQKAYKGDPADEITVYEDGGLVPLREVLPEMEGHFDPASLTEEQIENGLVDYRFEGADHSEAGDHVVLYLCENPNPSQAGSYQMIMSVFGRFKLDEAGNKYVRPEMRGNVRFETEKGKGAMEGALEKLKSE